MSRYYSYINSASEILKQYEGKQPFASFLKNFFSLQKKYGSRDRKQIGHLCYCYFRMGKDFKDLEITERLLTGLFLCTNEPNEILSSIRPEWDEKISFPLHEKLNFLATDHTMLTIFPWVDQLSEGMDGNLFNDSFLIQPDLFLRIRPGYEKKVLEKIKAKDWIFRQLSDHCIALPNAIKVDESIELDKEAVVQDYNSQRIAEFLDLVRPGRSDQVKVWDCCAGSGGKSILAKDVLGEIDLTVSDTRESILSNLKIRFQKAGIINFNSMVMNLAAPGSSLLAPSGGKGLPKAKPGFELIICDVPCTGSGTWGRSPEQLYFFEESKIEQYASLQYKIVSNMIPNLNPGGYFLYITCSVFRQENEWIVEFIKEKFNLTLLKKELLIGYDKKADSMFAALFIA